jgi:hypothetical protein
MITEYILLLESMNRIPCVHFSNNVMFHFSNFGEHLSVSILKYMKDNPVDTPI